MRFRYRLHWLAEHPYPPEPVAQCVATRIGRGGEPGKARPAGTVKFVVEFEGRALDALGPYAEPAAIVSVSRGKVSHVKAERVPGTSRWRGIFDLAVNGGSPVDLRLYLQLQDRALTETWLYQHFPADAG
jgi:glucans biosynthesis protein